MTNLKTLLETSTPKVTIATHEDFGDYFEYIFRITNPDNGKPILAVFHDGIIEANNEDEECDGKCQTCEVKDDCGEYNENGRQKSPIVSLHFYPDVDIFNMDKDEKDESEIKCDNITWEDDFREFILKFIFKTEPIPVTYNYLSAVLNTIFELRICDENESFGILDKYEEDIQIELTDDMISKIKIALLALKEKYPDRRLIYDDDFYYSGSDSELIKTALTE